MCSPEISVTSVISDFRANLGLIRAGLPHTVLEQRYELVLVMSVYTKPGLHYLQCVCVSLLPTVYFTLLTPVRMKLINRKLSV